MREDIEQQKDEVIEWIRENRAKSFICRKLNCQPVTLDDYLKKWHIIYKGNRGLLGYKQSSDRKPALYYIENNKPIGAHLLKLKLIEDGIKEHECENCKRKKWNNRPIPIELHHIDGNRYNNTLTNLQILCPNCHSMTDNHAGKGRRVRVLITEEIVDGVRVKIFSPEKGESKIKKIKKLKESKIFNKNCIGCGGEYLTKNKKGLYCSRACKQRGKTKINWPTDKELIHLICENSYVQIGKILGVSDNAVRRQVKVRNLDIASKYSHGKENRLKKKNTSMA